MHSVPAPPSHRPGSHVLYPSRTGCRVQPPLFPCSVVSCQTLAIAPCFPLSPLSHPRDAISCTHDAALRAHSTISRPKVAAVPQHHVAFPSTVLRAHNALTLLPRHALSRAPVCTVSCAHAPTILHPSYALATPTISRAPSLSAFPAPSRVCRSSTACTHRHACAPSHSCTPCLAHIVPPAYHHRVAPIHVDLSSAVSSTGRRLSCPCRPLALYDRPLLHTHCSVARQPPSHSQPLRCVLRPLSLTPALTPPRMPTYSLSQPLPHRATHPLNSRRAVCAPRLTVCVPRRAICALRCANSHTTVLPFLRPAPPSLAVAALTRPLRALRRPSGTISWPAALCHSHSLSRYRHVPLCGSRAPSPPSCRLSLQSCSHHAPPCHRPARPHRHHVPQRCRFVAGGPAPPSHALARLHAALVLSLRRNPKLSQPVRHVRAAPANSFAPAAARPAAAAAAALSIATLLLVAQEEANKYLYMVTH
ncbi:hypothetical protein DENSPDRAFT_882498 [Dentipellis sp. KUC8613]|nr:hypothetical protein DENSPDRAFT_882498 [Dentipellis sp. KUC8613]